MEHAQVQLRSLDTLWFQVAGTLCNLACTHCLISASPTNRTHEMLSLERIRPFLDEGAALGVKEYYFTGGEPFMNPEMEEILEVTLGDYGPATVLTNGLMLGRERSRRLARLSVATDYSLDLRISLDGFDSETNDAIRGSGSFERILRGVRNLAAAGVNPVITVTEACAGVSTEEGFQSFVSLLRECGIEKPRLKVLPLFRIGSEVDRGGGYDDWQRLIAGDLEAQGDDHLQCSSSRMVTSRGVWVCPILINEPSARMGDALADTLRPFGLEHQACWTCHVEGASCRT